MSYTGNKGGQGIREFLINYIPVAERYFSFFYGHGGFENCNLVKGIDWICSEKDQALQLFSTPTAVIVENDYKDLVVKNTFTSADFVFADPPYLMETRRAGRSYYKHEFSTDDHVQFISTLRYLDCMVLITHPKCDLYDEYLAFFECIPFKYMTRAGWFCDSIYINFSPASVGLLNYNGLGFNSMERQQIKRKRKSILNKIKCLPILERMALMREIDQL